MIPSGVAKIWSFQEESLSDSNQQTIDIKSGISAENLGLAMTLTFCPKIYMCLHFFILFCSSVENCLSYHVTTIVWTDRQTDKQTDRQSDYYRIYAFTMVGSLLSKSNMTVRRYGPETDFGYVLTLTLIFVDITLGHGHDIPSVHWQLLFKIISRFNVTIRSYA